MYDINKHLDRVEEVKDGDMYTRHPIGLLVKTVKNRLFRFSHVSGGNQFSSKACEAGCVVT